LFSQQIRAEGPFGFSAICGMVAPATGQVAMATTRIGGGWVIVMLLLCLAVGTALVLGARKTAETGPLDQRDSEASFAYRDHQAIGSFLYRCMDEAIRKGGPYTVDLADALYVRGFPGTPSEPHQASRDLTRAEQSIAYLTKTIAAQRLSLDDRTASSWWFMTVVMVAGFIFTLATNIALAVRDSEHFQKHAGVIRTCAMAAMLCSALGTTYTSFVAFYKPQEVHAENRINLDRYRQLHTRIAIELALDECTGGKPGPEVTDMLRGWQQRYQDIVSSGAATVGTRPQATGAKP